MIQFNLLPDVKLEYIRTRRIKRLVTLAASGIAGVTFMVMLLLFIGVNFVQKNHIKNLNSDIKKSSDHIRSIEDLDKILTVQNQLHTLPGLHDKKPVVSRLSEFLSKVTPSDVTISRLDLKFVDTTMAVSGGSDSLASINQFVDTLKFATYTTEEGGEEKPAFSNVVLSSFGRGEKEATYMIDLQFDRVIFDGTEEVTLNIPDTITTRSEIAKPLFEAPKEEQ